MIRTIARKKLAQRGAALAVAVTLAVFALAPPAASHGQGGVPAQLDVIEEKVDRNHEASQGEHANLTSEHADLSDDHAFLRADHDALADAHGNLSAEHADLSDGQNGLAADHDDQDAALTRLSDDHDAIDATLADHGTRLATLESRLDFLHLAAEPSVAGIEGGDAESEQALVLVRVTFEGAGVTGLDASAFAFNTRLVPSGACVLAIDQVTEFDGGDYSVRVSPDGCTWSAGDYVASLVATSGGVSGSTLTKLTIPAPVSAEDGSGGATGSGGTTEARPQSSPQRSLLPPLPV